ncbi:MAG TPA: DUF58 domain-containing protein, partial [Chitinophagaceae bacterium]|nr:DUF58 domain-containing protein [Chitinophagaceae bacterium]
MLRKLLYRFSFFGTRYLYSVVVLAVLISIAAYWQPRLLQITKIVVLAIVLMLLVDFLLLYIKKQPIRALRQMAERLSNGDENNVRLLFENNYGYPVHVTVIEELPPQLSQQSFTTTLSLPAQKQVVWRYTVTPAERGVYEFGNINIIVRGVLFMIERHIVVEATQRVAVYPAFIQMRRFQLLAVTNQLNDVGSRRLRKLGNSLEFEQIKEYVTGDDYRNINWKATARKGSLMVNNFMDERSQQVICVIDKGRTMKMPFEGMTLLDYAVNASLVLSNVVLNKQDKAGVVVFGKKLDQLVQPDKKSTQINFILENLYRLQSDFTDSDFGNLYTSIRYRIKQRSLLVLFTNFESMYGMHRQLHYLQQLNNHHTLLVVFFENTELQALEEQKVTDLEGVYLQTVAKKFALEKRLIVKELNKYGIMSMLTAPQHL